MPRSDLPSSIVLLVFGLAVAFESWRMPRFESIGGSILNAPGLVPGLLGLVIALLGGVMLARYLVARRGAVVAAGPQQTTGTAVDSPPGEISVAPDEAVDEEAADTIPPSNTRVLAALVLGVVFAAGLIGRMPFWLAVFLFVFASIVYNERAALKGTTSAIRLLLIAGAIAGATGFAVPFVFEKVFLVNLP